MDGEWYGDCEEREIFKSGVVNGNGWICPGRKVG